MKTYKIEMGGCLKSHFTISLPDSLELAEYTDKYSIPEYNKYFGVYQGEFSWEGPTNAWIINTVHLPGLVIVYFQDIKFLGTDSPKLISVLEVNQKLSKIRRKIIFTDEDEIPYKLAWISGELEVTLISLEGEILVDQDLIDWEWNENV